MKNYYELLNISINSTSEQIKYAYQKQISAFNHLPFLSNDHVNKVKEYKCALYILSNPKLKDIYDKKLDSFLNNQNTFDYDVDIQGSNTFDIDNNYEINNNEELNDTQETLQIPQNNDMKKNKFNPNILGNRIFSLSHLNKTPILTDFQMKLRKPENGRIEKND